MAASPSASASALSPFPYGFVLAYALLAVGVSVGALSSPVPAAGAIGGFVCALSLTGAHRDRVALLGGALLLSAAVTTAAPFQLWPTAGSAPLHGLALLAAARAWGVPVSAGVAVVLSTLAFAPLDALLAGRLLAAAAADTVAVFAAPLLHGAFGGLVTRGAVPSPLGGGVRALTSVLWVVSVGLAVASQLGNTAALPALVSAFAAGTVAILAADALNRSPAPFATPLSEQLGASVSESEFGDLYSYIVFWVRFVGARASAGSAKAHDLISGSTPPH